MTFRPMLACKTPSDLSQLTYPMLSSYKLDGIRAFMWEGRMMSRSMKLLPNQKMQNWFQARPGLEGFDGELIVGPHDNSVYRRTMSAIMSIDGNPMEDLTWYVFDTVGIDKQFAIRINTCREIIGQHDVVKVLAHKVVHSPDDVLAHHAEAIATGHEGLVLRAPDEFYKRGRSTMREQGMVKIKMFEDSEAEILGMVELMHNNNEAVENELGLTKRSSHKENKRPAGILGALQVRDLKTGVEFEIGTGFTDTMRHNYWNGVDDMKGLIVKYKFFPVGVKDKPRHPVFLGFRAAIDR